MPRITLTEIEAAIVRQDVFTVDQGVAGATLEANRGKALDVLSIGTPVRLSQVTLCVLTLSNGCVQVGVNYGPIDAADFDPARARRMARQDAIEKLRPMFAFAERQRRFEVLVGGAE